MYVINIDIQDDNMHFVFDLNVFVVINPGIIGEQSFFLGNFRWGGSPWMSRWKWSDQWLGSMGYFTYL